MDLKKGCVYFFRHLTLKPVKIGYSDSSTPKNRFATFKTYAPFGAELLGFISSSNANVLEKKIHKKLKHKRLEGEWFDITDEEVKEIIDFYSKYNNLISASEFQEKYMDFVETKYKETEDKIYNEIIYFLSDYNLTNYSVSRIKLRKLFYDDTKIELTPQKFNKYVRKYCKKNLIKLKEKKINGEILFFFK